MFSGSYSCLAQYMPEEISIFLTKVLMSFAPQRYTKNKTNINILKSKQIFNIDKYINYYLLFLFQYLMQSNLIT